MINLKSWIASVTMLTRDGSKVALKKEVWIEDSWNKCYFKWQKSSDKNKCTFQCSILAHLKAICFLQQKDHTETKNKGWKGCMFLLNIFKWQILFACIYETCIWKHSFYCASLIIALENIFKSKQKFFLSGIFSLHLEEHNDYCKQKKLRMVYCI